MREQLKRMLMTPPPPKCAKCKGSGIVVEQGPYWSPQPCWCAACFGSGKANSDGSNLTLHPKDKAHL